VPDFAFQQMFLREFNQELRIPICRFIVL